MRKIKILTCFVLCVIVFSNISTATQYIWNDDTVQTSSEDTVKADNFLNLESASAILIEQNSGTILYEHNAHEQLRPASVTKIMSILLIMEAIDSGKINLTDRVPCSEHASKMGGSQIWLNTTEELTVEELLKAVCVVSANDAVTCLAEYVCGSEEFFVQKMNEKAKELGMNDTTFKNCHGLDEDGHVTSSYDIALMSRELLKNHPSITKYTTIWMDSLRDGKSELVNTNKLLKTYKGATGLKTGSTSLALYNLSASATRDDLSLIAVIMKGPTSKIRFNEAKKLLDFGFNNYKFEKLATKDNIITTVEVEKGIKNYVDVAYEKDGGALLKREDSGNIENEITINQNVKAPIYKGDVLGEVSFIVEGSEVDKVNLIATEDIEKVTTWNMVTNIYNSWFNLLK